MCLEHICDCGIGDVVVDVLKSSLNTIVASRGILPGEVHDGIHDYLANA